MDATEICILWGDWQIQRWWSCMTKSEWSGWAQAIGVAVALASPWIGGRIAKFRVRPVARDVYVQFLRFSNRANRLDVLMSNVLNNPAGLVQAHQEAVLIIRSLRDFTDFEIDALRLYSGVAASRLRTCGVLQAKLSGLFDLPMNMGNQHFALNFLMDEAYKHARELKKNCSEAVSLMEKSGLSVRNKLKDIEGER